MTSQTPKPWTRGLLHGKTQGPCKPEINIDINIFQQLDDWTLIIDGTVAPLEMLQNSFSPPHSGTGLLSTEGYLSRCFVFSKENS